MPVEIFLSRSKSSGHSEFYTLSGKYFYTGCTDFVCFYVLIQLTVGNNMLIHLQISLPPSPAKGFACIQSKTHIDYRVDT